MSATLYRGDCLVEMANVADGSVDLILADLPYGTTACLWDSVIPLEPLWAHYKRIIKPRGAVVLTASQPFTTALISSNMNWFKYCWVWDKSNAGDCMNAKNKPMKKHEDICVFSSGTTANKSPNRMPYFPQGLIKSERYRRGSTVFGYGAGGGSFKVARPSHHEYQQDYEGYPTSVLFYDNEKPAVHPTQKPVALMEYLIRTYTNEGELVLDNTMGSGTTGVACVNTNRRFIGIERDDKYFAIAEKRISDAVTKRATELQQLTLAL